MATAHLSPPGSASRRRFSRKRCAFARGNKQLGLDLESLARLAAQHGTGLLVALEIFFLGIPGELSPQQHGDVCQVADAHAAVVGHAGYLETVRRAFVYTLGLNGMESSADEVKQVMASWQELSPFPEVRVALERLKDRYKLVVLSNGDPDFLEHLVKNRVNWAFDDVISVTEFGVFKPHPTVYLGAAGVLGLEVGECLMVSANLSLIHI